MNAYLQHRTLFGPQIYNRVSPNLGITVVVPANDEPELLRGLMSLAKCDFALADTEIIVVVYNELGASEALVERNRATYLQALEWAKTQRQPRRRFHVLFYDDLPRKHCGPGLARKIGMDEACYRYEKIRQRRGIITCFDADSRAEKNYLTAIEHYFKRNRQKAACTIYHEHPMTGIDHDEAVYRGVRHYELHQRYVVRGLRRAGLPHAFQTVGSSLAVRAAAYQREGGMSKRPCGAGFAFLHKFSATDELGECHTTRVQTAPRPPQRPWYGSERTLADLLGKRAAYPVVPPAALAALGRMCADLPAVYRECAEHLPNDWCAHLRRFLEEEQLGARLPDLRREAGSDRDFCTRFFRWFHAQRCHDFLRQFRRQQPDCYDLLTAAAHQLEQEGHTLTEAERRCERRLLRRYRALDRPV